MKHLIKAYSLDDVLYRWDEKEDKEELRVILLNAFCDESLEITDPNIDMSCLDTEQDIAHFLGENEGYGICYFPSGKDFIFKEIYWAAIWGFVNYGHAFKGSAVPIQTALENLCVKKQDFLAWLKRTDQALPDFWFSMKEKRENQTIEGRKKALAMAAFLDDPEHQKKMLQTLDEINARKGIPILLHEWFKHDSWKNEEGLMLLSGMSPETLFGHDESMYGEPLRIVRYFETLDGLEGDPTRASEYVHRLSSYERLWESGEHPLRAPPKYFINWAISKNVSPGWLNWAIENQYFSPIPDDTNQTKEISGKSETAYLNIIGALCDLYWKAAKPNQPKINQSELIANLENYTGFHGLSNRNLKDKLSKAIRSILNE